MASGKEYYTYDSYCFAEGEEYQLIDKKWILDPKGGTGNYIYFENFTVDKPPAPIASINSIYKLHCAIDTTDQGNVEKATQVLLKFIETTDLPVFCKVTAPECSTPRDGAEITIYPPADMRFKSNEAAAQAWIVFADALAEAFHVAGVKTTSTPQSDRPINMYVSYRVGKSGAGDGKTMDLCGGTDYGKYCNYAPYEVLSELASQEILHTGQFYNPTIYVKEKDGSYNNGYNIGKKTILKSGVNKEDLHALPDALGEKLTKQIEQGKRNTTVQQPYLGKTGGKKMESSAVNSEPISYNDAIAILNDLYHGNEKGALKNIVKEHDPHYWRNHITRKDVQSAIESAPKL